MGFLSSPSAVCVAQLSSLTGRTAPPELLQTLTFVARNHHPDIVAIDTVRAYHYGYNFMVELDIVLHPEMPLRVAHDIGESLQNKLETIDKVRSPPQFASNLGLIRFWYRWNVLLFIWIMSGIINPSTLVVANFTHINKNIDVLII